MKGFCEELLDAAFKAKERDKISETVLTYIMHVLAQSEFQANPAQYIDTWKKRRDKEGTEVHCTGDQARDFIIAALTQK